LIIGHMMMAVERGACDTRHFSWRPAFSENRACELAAGGEGTAPPGQRRRSLKAR
jgi:hypothetical protein